MRSKNLYRDLVQTVWLGLIVNLILGVIKLCAGLYGHSFALMVDAGNSLADVVTSIVVLVALWAAQRPPDKEHPYGHARAESIAASNISLLLALGAIFMGYEALARIYIMHDMPPLWTLWVAGGNFIIKEVLYRYKRSVGERTGSGVMLALAWDHRADGLASLAVMVGLALVRVGGPNYIWADEAAALLIVLAILYSAYKLFRQSLHDLMDPQANQEMVDQVQSLALSVKGVKAIETLWLRKVGLEYFADVHIEVPSEMTVAEGHKIGHQVKDRILDHFENVRDVLVHLEPNDC